MTLLNINNALECIAKAEPNVNSVLPAFTDLNRETAVYSSVILQQQQHTRSDDFIYYNYYIGYADRLVEDESNEVEVQSTAIEIINDIINAMNNTYPYDVTATNYSVFTQRFTALAAGAYASVSIEVPIGECAENDDFLATISRAYTSNGEYTITAPKGVIGIKKVNVVVNVDDPGAVMEEKSVTITENGEKEVTPSEGYTGMSKVTITTTVPDRYDEGYNSGYEAGYDVGYEGGFADGQKVQKGLLDEIEITANGTYEKENGYKKVVVNVSGGSGSYDEGYKDGYEKGKTDGYNDGYEKGYTAGKADGIAEQKGKLSEIAITENGTYEDEDGYSKVEVNVPTMGEEEKEVSYTSNGTYEITPSSSDRLISKAAVIVSVPSPSGTINIDENGTFDVTDYDKAIVAVSGGSFIVPNGMKFTGSTLTEFPSTMDFSQVTDGTGVFSNCSNLTTLPSTFDWSILTDAQQVIYQCRSITSLPDNLDFANAAVVSYIATETGIESINGLKFKEGATIYYLFQNAEKLETVDNLDLTNCDFNNWKYVLRYTESTDRLTHVGFIGQIGSSTEDNRLYMYLNGCDDDTFTSFFTACIANGVKPTGYSWIVDFCNSYVINEDGSIQSLMSQATANGWEFRNINFLDGDPLTVTIDGGTSTERCWNTSVQPFADVTINVDLPDEEPYSSWSWSIPSTLMDEYGVNLDAIAVPNTTSRTGAGSIIISATGGTTENDRTSTIVIPVTTPIGKRYVTLKMTSSGDRIIAQWVGGTVTRAYTTASGSEYTQTFNGSDTEVTTVRYNELATGPAGSVYGTINGHGITQLLRWDTRVSTLTHRTSVIDGGTLEELSGMNLSTLVTNSGSETTDVGNAIKLTDSGVKRVINNIFSNLLYNPIQKTIVSGATNYYYAYMMGDTLEEYSGNTCVGEERFIPKQIGSSRTGDSGSGYYNFFQYMFLDCSALTTIADISLTGKNANYLLSNCPNVTSITNVVLDGNYMTDSGVVPDITCLQTLDLTADSVEDIFNSLVETTYGVTIYIKKSVLSQVGDDTIAIATGKGYKVASY